MPSSASRARARRFIKARRWRRPPLTIVQILAWADEHFERTGRWPKRESGRVRDQIDDTWRALDGALAKGFRGLEGGESLARLLARARGVRNKRDLPPLSVPQILAWADEHYQQTGQWPTTEGGCVAGENGETWMGIHRALRSGWRGLPGRDSLARLLARERGAPNHKRLPSLRVRQILAWADEYRSATGRWPKEASEPTAGMEGMRWSIIDSALREGARGLPGGDSLARLLARKRGARNCQALPDLSMERILAWADEHRRRTGRWPSHASGRVTETGHETWSRIDEALRTGRRALPGGDTLRRLLARERSSA